MLKQYFSITKPGIIFGNAVSVIGGFVLASGKVINWSLFLATIIGAMLVIASGCAFNNYIDRDIDKVMQRTKNRALAQGLIQPKIALVYASLMGLIGISTLYFMTNALAAGVAFFGFLIYVGVYSLYMKRHSVYCTLIGSISGAAPPLIGYCAVANRLDLCALIIFCIFSLWQIPHSYAIAIFRLNDYKAAAIPVLPVKFGIAAAKIQITLYILAFTLSALMLAILGYTGIFYFISTSILCMSWLSISVKGYKLKDDAKWAKQVFIFSLIIIILLSLLMSLDRIN